MTNSDHIAVVGSGAAGLSAALAAACSGANVTVYERTERLGGTTAMSGGGMWIPDNPLLRANGRADSSAQAETYLRKVTHGQVPESLLQAFLEAGPKAIAFFQDELDVELVYTSTPDYQASFPGALDGGRTVSTGLFDTKKLGEHRALLRPLPTTGSPPLLHEEQMGGNWGVGAGENVESMNVLALERIQQGIAGRGNALAAALIHACLRRGVEFVTSARVVEIEFGGERVERITVARDGIDGREPVGAVVLAAGGFEWNKKLWDRFVGAPYGPMSPPGNEGDGLSLAYRAGALVGNLQNAWWCPAIQVDGDEIDGKATHRLFTFSKGFPGAIAVNSTGRRFANESMNYNDFGQQMARFDSHTYDYVNDPTWIIMDEEHVDAYGILDKKFGEAWLHSSDTLAGLASKIGVDASGLEAQVREFNTHAAEGRDPTFHRGESAWETYRADPMYANPTVRPLEGSKFYAYRQRLGTLGTNGGAVIDEQARVVNFDGRPIGGLFAAGNTTASIFGRAYPGGGATLGPAVTFGYLAGQTAAS